MIRKRIITIVAVVAVVALLIKGKGLLNTRKAENAAEAMPSKQALTVPIVEAKQGTLQNKIPFLAQILSDKHIQLSTKLAGYVEKVLVEESQMVKKGDVLVRIDAIEIRSNIDALRSTLKAQEGDLALVKSIYVRNKKLNAIGGLSKEQLESSKVALSIKASALEGTKQKIAQLKHQLSYLKIVAPFDGYIDAILMHEGDLAATGKPILSMSNGKKKLVFSYSPAQQSLIKKEQDVYVDGKEVGYVKSIYTTAKNGLITAEVKLNEAVVAPAGSSITMEVLVKEKSGCILPDTTIVHKKEGTFVMAYENGKFIPYKVEVEMQDKDSILVSPCPKTAVAQASEVKLAQLPAYNKVGIGGAK
jgi:membrane fusion protein (multidrug efflux system)